MSFFNTICYRLGFKQYALHESSIGRIYQHTTDRTFGMMTAFRGEYDIAINRKRNSELQSSIRSNGFGFIKLTGHYPEEGKPVEEEAFLIISSKDDSGHLKGFLKASGIKWDQDSVLYKEFGENAVLLGTAGGLNATGGPRWPGLGAVFDLGEWKPRRIGDMYSKLKGRSGRSFTFESVSYAPTLFTRMYGPKID